MDRKVGTKAAYCYSLGIGRESFMRRTYYVLDALRGVAAIAVIILHGQDLFGWYPPMAALAVDIFFVLSGFVITHAYETRLEGGMAARQFVRLRLIRFWPLYLVGLILGFGVEAGKLLIGYSNAMSAFGVGSAFMLGLFFLPSLPGTSAALFPLNGPSWSLFFELLVNSAYATFHRHMSNRMLALLMVISTIALVIGTILMGSPLGGVSWQSCWLGFARAGFSFPTGVLLYRLYRQRNFRLSWLVPCVILAAMMSYLPDRFGGWYELSFILLASPLLVILAASIEPPKWAIPICGYLGVTSYAIYAIHQPIMAVGHFAAMRGLMPPLPVGVLIVIMLGILCPLLDRYYDRPVRRFIDRCWPAQSNVTKFKLNKLASDS